MVPKAEGRLSQLEFEAVWHGSSGGNVEWLRNGRMCADREREIPKIMLVFELTKTVVLSTFQILYTTRGRPRSTKCV